jgi:serine/threonine protein kinase
MTPNLATLIAPSWHQDVKPGNILVTSLSESIQSPYEYKFKLADLGISHFKSQVSSLEDSTDRDSQGTRTYGEECHL